jgi:hypothetical protein
MLSISFLLFLLSFLSFFPSFFLCPTNYKMEAREIPKLPPIIEAVNFSNNYPAYDKTEQVKAGDKAKFALYRSHPVCPLRDLTSTRLATLKRLIETEFVNHEVMEAFSCFFWNATTNYLETRNWLTPNRVLGKGKYGVVFSVNIKELMDIAAIKTSPSVLHEWAIGRFVTNNMRYLNPNFSYVYTAFDCSGAYLLDNKTIGTFCASPTLRPNEDPKANDFLDDSFLNPKLTELKYLATEKISGILLDDYMKDCEPISFWGAIFQLVFALRQAHEKYDYTHYDLHLGNVIMRPILPGPETGSLSSERKERGDIIPYVFQDNPNIYLALPDNKIATIIDYGLSRAQVTIDGKSVILASEDFPEFSVDHSHAFPLYDFFKLISICYQHSYNINRNDLKSEIEKVYDFLYGFHPSFNDVIAHSKRLFAIPPKPEYLAVTWKQISDMLIKLVPYSTQLISDSSISDSLVTCLEEFGIKCENKSEIDEELRTKAEPMPENVHEFSNAGLNDEISPLDIEIYYDELKIGKDTLNNYISKYSVDSTFPSPSSAQGVSRINDLIYLYEVWGGILRKYRDLVVARKDIELINESEIGIVNRELYLAKAAVDAVADDPNVSNRVKMLLEVSELAY